MKQVNFAQTLARLHDAIGLGDVARECSKITGKSIAYTTIFPVFSGRAIEPRYSTGAAILAVCEKFGVEVVYD